MNKGTQRENEKMMAELERSKKREKMLEAELKKLCGDNWQVCCITRLLTIGVLSSI